MRAILQNDDVFKKVFLLLAKHLAQKGVVGCNNKNNNYKNGLISEAFLHDGSTSSVKLKDK